jgi:hypothetical protein
MSSTRSARNGVLGLAAVFALLAVILLSRSAFDIYSAPMRSSGTAATISARAADVCAGTLVIIPELSQVLITGEINQKPIHGGRHTAPMFGGMLAVHANVRLD